MNHTIKKQWIALLLTALATCSCNTTKPKTASARSSLFRAEQSLYDWPTGFEISGKKPSYEDIRSYWVPAQIQDNKLVEAHKVWMIEGELKWIQK